MKCRTCKKEFEPRHEKDYFCLPCNSLRGKRNKNKGRANEHRFAKNLQKRLDVYGVPIRVRRTPASGAIHEFEAGDLLFSGKGDTMFEKIHWELKNTQNWQIEKWMQKAKDSEEEMRKFREPVLIVRKPGRIDEYAIINAGFLIDLIIENEILKKEADNQ